MTEKKLKYSFPICEEDLIKSHVTFVDNDDHFNYQNQLDTIIWSKVKEYSSNKFLLLQLSF